MTRQKASISLAFLLVALSWANASPAVTFTAPELLGRPTDTSVTLHAMADSALEAYVEYDPSPGSYGSQTQTATYAKGAPIVIKLENLAPDTRYYYRLRYRQPGAGAFEARPEFTFHTQRGPGGTFTFTVQSDSHIYDKKGDHGLYTVALNNQAADSPDFMLDLGDTFGDDHNAGTITYEELDKLHLDQRPFMSIVGGSAPVFLCLGNHEGEGGYYLGVTPPNNIAINGTKARQKYYPNPEPDSFYSGNGTPEEYVGLPQNYYAWRWGNALFVVLDVYRYNEVDPKSSGNMWDWTLGKAQYDWLKATLEGSDARFKFLFAHHVLGQTRGAANWAGMYEWGGKNKQGIYEFESKRPGWAKPIQQLMADTGVTIFFQGHDHLYAVEEVGGVIYQEVPMPSDATYHVGDPNADDYTGPVINDSGHLRVTVSPSRVAVDYIRAYLPGDGTNGEVARSYYVGSPQLPGDCDGDSAVGIAEVQRAINMFLGLQPAACGADCDGNGQVAIGELQKVINGFLGLDSNC